MPSAAGAARRCMQMHHQKRDCKKPRRKAGFSLTAALGVQRVALPPRAFRAPRLGPETRGFFKRDV
jgi:hypothetical protein